METTMIADYSEIISKLDQIQDALTKSGALYKQDLLTALCKAQGEYLEVKKDSAQSASMHAIMKACRQALVKNGLSFTQLLNDTDTGDRELTTILGHSSGQFIESVVKIRPLRNDKNQEQSNEATLNFIKKQTAKAILGITVPNDLMDDDADCLYEEPSLDDLDEIFSNPKTPNKRTDTYLSNEQYEDLSNEIRDYPEIGESLLKKFSITTLTQMKRSDYRKTIEEIRRLKMKYQKARDAQ